MGKEVKRPGRRIGHCPSTFSTVARTARAPPPPIIHTPVPTSLGWRSRHPGGGTESPAFTLPPFSSTSDKGESFILAETYITVNTHQHASSIRARIIVNAVRKRLQFHSQSHNKYLCRLKLRLLILFFIGFKPRALLLLLFFLQPTKRYVVYGI
jgi:hypothetical protein